MIKRIVLIFVCGLVFCECYSQNPLVKQWDYRFGGVGQDGLSCFQQTSDGGYVLAGTSFSDSSGDKTQNSRGIWDYWIVKIDSLGNKQWDKDFGGTNLEELNSIKETNDHGFILGGNSRSGNNGDKTQNNWDTTENTADFWIMKIDSVGSKEWDKDFGGTNGDQLNSIQQTSDGGFILAGSSKSDSSGDKTQNSKGGFDYWIIKTDAFGNKQWDRDFGGIFTDYLNSIQQTSDNGFILAGTSSSDSSGDKTQNTRGFNDYWIIKTDSLGNKEWDKDFGGNNGDELYSIDQTNDGGYILGGLSFSPLSGDKTQNTWGGWDYWIVKTDSLGNKQWDKDFGGTGDEYYFGNIVKSDNGYLFAGNSYSNIGGNKTENNLGIEQIWVVKTDSVGSIQWDKTIFTTAQDIRGFATKTKDGCYAFANSTHAGVGGYKTQPSWNNSTDYWIIKFCDSTLTTSTSIFNIQHSIFNIYPNPARGTIQLTINTNHNAPLQCEIINVMGETVFKSQIVNPKSQINMDVSFLAKGIYVVRVGDGEKWENKKLVVE